MTLSVSLALYGTPERIRTSDLSLRKALLYPAELREQKKDTQPLLEVFSLARPGAIFNRRRVF